MDMITQMMEQMQSAVNQATNRNPASQKNKTEGKDFDQMVRQKQKDVRKGRPERKQPDDKKPGTEVATQNEAVNQDQQPLADQQYLLAAAMMIQYPQNVETVEVQTEDVLPVLDTGVVTEAPLEAVTETVQQTVTEKPLDAPVEVRQQVVETEERPVEVEVADTEKAVAVTAERLEAKVQTVEEETAEDAAPVVVEQQQQQQVPVFEQVEATPVKVAEPTDPVRLADEDGMEQLSAQIERFLVNENGSETVELTLEPASLGKVRVEIVHNVDGSLHVHLSAGNERALGLLNRGAETLQHLMNTENRPSVTVQVRSSGQSEQQFLNPNGDPNQQQRQQQQQQQNRHQHDRTQDFMQQLRLGLVGTNDGE